MTHELQGYQARVRHQKKLEKQLQKLSLEIKKPQLLEENKKKASNDKTYVR